MPDLTEEQIEEATYRGQKRALEEHADRERFDPMGNLRRGFEEAGDPERVRLERRRQIGPDEGGEDDDGDE